MLTTTSAQAQVINLLDEYYDELDQQSSKNAGSLLRSGSPVTINDNGGITNNDFEAPIGSGIVILLGAGLGYVALKKKEDKQ